MLPCINPHRAIPNTMRLKDQAKLQHCNDSNTLLSPHHISFPIQRGRLFAMTSMQFTVDSAKKKEFINIFLLMPESTVLNAMRQVTFTKEDIANVRLRRFLQRALPGGSIKELKTYIAHQRKPSPHLPVDPVAADPRLPMTRQYLVVSKRRLRLQRRQSHQLWRQQSHQKRSSSMPEPPRYCCPCCRALPKTCKASCALMATGHSLLRD